MDVDVDAGWIEFEAFPGLALSGCGGDGGSATIALRDSTGALVYSRNLAGGGSFTSTAGLASAWTIRLTLTQVRGTLNFRAQKKT